MIYDSNSSIRILTIIIIVLSGLRSLGGSSLVNFVAEQARTMNNVPLLVVLVTSSSYSSSGWLYIRTMNYDSSST